MRGRGAGPQAEGAVDVDPGAVLVGGVAHGVEGIERAAVDLSRLRADDRRAVAGGERGAQRVGPHRALVVGLDAHDAVGAQAEQPHGPPQRDVEVAVGQQADRRRAREPPRLDVPPGPLEDVVARGAQAGGVGHLAAGGDGERRGLRQAEELGQPAADDLLGHRGGGRGDVEDRVLIPGRGHPVGRQGRGQRAPEDEAEEARRLAGHQAGVGARPPARRGPRADPRGRRAAGRPARRAAPRGRSRPARRGARATRRGSPPRAPRRRSAARASPSRDSTPGRPRSRRGPPRGSPRTSDRRRRSSSPSCRPRCAWRAARATSSGSSSSCPPPGRRRPRRR